MRTSVQSPLAILALLLSPATALRAQPGTVEPPSKPIDGSLSLRFSTLGFGLEAGKLLTNHISARLGGNFFSLSRSGDASDVTYDFHIKWHAASLLFDLAPHRRGALHFTLGFMTNPVTISATGQPTGGEFTINDHHYTSAEVGTLTGKGKFQGMGPYLGFGFGTAARKGGRLKFLFDLGAVLGKARFELSATGAANNAQLASDLEAQRVKTQKDINKFAKAYPVLSFGLGYHF